MTDAVRYLDALGVARAAVARRPDWVERALPPSSAYAEAPMAAPPRPGPDYGI